MLEPKTTKKAASPSLKRKEPEGGLPKKEEVEKEKKEEEKKEEVKKEEVPKKVEIELVEVPKPLGTETTVTVKDVPADEKDVPTCLHCFHCKRKQPIVDLKIGETTFRSQKMMIMMSRATWIAKCQVCNCAVRSFKKNGEKVIPVQVQEEKNVVEEKK